MTVSFVAEPARITTAPRRSVKLLDNSVLTLVCRASGNPAPEVYWSRGGRRVAAGASRRYRVLEVDAGSVLRVDRVRLRRDDGRVQCVADNGVSEPDTADTAIHVYTPDNGQPLLLAPSSSS